MQKKRNYARIGDGMILASIRVFIVGGSFVTLLSASLWSPLIASAWPSDSPATTWYPTSDNAFRSVADPWITKAVPSALAAAKSQLYSSAFIAEIERAMKSVMAGLRMFI